MLGAPSNRSILPDTIWLLLFEFVGEQHGNISDIRELHSIFAVITFIHFSEHFSHFFVENPFSTKYPLLCSFWVSRKKRNITLLLSFWICRSIVSSHRIQGPYFAPRWTRSSWKSGSVIENTFSQGWKYKGIRAQVSICQVLLKLLKCQDLDIWPISSCSMKGEQKYREKPN